MLSNFRRICLMQKWLKMLRSCASARRWRQGRKSGWYDLLFNERRAIDVIIVEYFSLNSLDWEFIIVTLMTMISEFHLQWGDLTESPFLIIRWFRRQEWEIREQETHLERNHPICCVRFGDVCHIRALETPSIRRFIELREFRETLCVCIKNFIILSVTCCSRELSWGAPESKPFVLDSSAWANFSHREM